MRMAAKKSAKRFCMMCGNLSAVTIYTIKYFVSQPQLFHSTINLTKLVLFDTFISCFIRFDEYF